MLVRDRMSRAVHTVTPDLSFDQALRQMRERKVRRFPVVDTQGRMVGIVSEKDLLNAAPSPATSLERHELHALLAKLKVSEVMSRNVIVINDSLPIEEAARIMADNKIGGVPVVDERQTLVGIITETDVFRTLLDMFGARRKGLRITFSVEDQRGALAQLAGEVARQGGDIIAVSVVPGADQQHRIFTLKLDNADEERLTAMLRGRGAEILDIRKV